MGADGNRGPYSLRNVLGGVTSRLGLDGGLDTATVWSRWPSLVGASIAEHVEPTSLRRGVLKVRADSPAWATEIGYLGDEIRRRVNAEVGRPLVNEVRVWTSPGPVRRRSADPVPRIRQGSEDVSSAPSEAPEDAFQRAQKAWRERCSERQPRSP